MKWNEKSSNNYKSFSSVQLPSQRTSPLKVTQQNKIKQFRPGNSTKKKDVPFKQEQQRRRSESRSKNETPTNKSKEENQRIRSQSNPKTEISQKNRFESLEDMELEDQKTLKLSKHNPKTNMSYKEVQNSTIEMEEGNPSPNQLMDNRIQNSLEEPGTETKIKTVEWNLHKADS